MNDEQKELLDSLREGDRVELRLAGDDAIFSAAVIVDTVAVRSSDFKVLENFGISIEAYMIAGYELAVLKRAVTIPEPGVYYDRVGDIWAFPSANNVDSEPRLVTTDLGDHSTFRNVRDWQNFTPYTRIPGFND